MRELYTDNLWRPFGIFDELEAERQAQFAKFGDQSDLPNGTDWASDLQRANEARDACQAVFKQGRGTWRHIFLEEVREAIAESDPVRLRAELVQCAAVSIAWIEALDVNG